jgi:carbamoyl-phosphate synthase large subunit
MIRYFKEALNNCGMVYASNSILTYSMLQADGYIITPAIYDETYIDFLINYAKGKKINAIISLFDIDLLILTCNKHRFEDIGIKLVVSNEEAISICNDKWKTYTFLTANLNLKSPTTYISMEEAKNNLDKKVIYYPLILKPRWGMGSIGIYIAENNYELKILYRKVLNDIEKTYLKYESQVDLDHAVIIQEKIDGTEYGLDILNDLNGEYVTTIAKQKLAMRAGETDVAQIVDNYRFIDESRMISKSLRHVGNLDVDCFLTDENEIFILEMNCRFGGQYPFSHIAGVDFPKQIIKWLMLEETDLQLTTPTLGIVGCKDLHPVIFK